MYGYAGARRCLEALLVIGLSLHNTYSQAMHCKEEARPAQQCSAARNLSLPHMPASLQEVATIILIELT